MKKEQDLHVDEHFRQKEVEIPVPYNPQHWEQLAQWLDQMDARPTPPKSPRPQKSIKAWWVTGLWLIMLSAIIWSLMKPAANSIAPTGTTLRNGNETSTVSPKAPEGHVDENFAPGQSGGVQEFKSMKADEPGLERPVTSNKFPHSEDAFDKVKDSVAMRHNQLSAPDSIGTPAVPIKKKKLGLFW